MSQRHPGNMDLISCSFFEIREDQPGAGWEPFEHQPAAQALARWTLRFILAEQSVTMELEASHQGDSDVVPLV